MELIRDYIEANQDEELNKYGSSYTDFSSPEDNSDKSVWLSIRDIPINEFTKDDLDFVRSVLERIATPRGGYIYRDFHYLGYYNTMGILIPNGFSVNQPETDRAWTGGRAEIYYNFARSDEGLFVKWRGSARSVYNMYWNAQTFYRRYILISSEYISYPSTWINDIMNALMSDIYFLKVRYATAFGPSTPADMYGGIGTLKGQPVQWATVNLAWFLSEMKFMIRQIVKGHNTIPWPIPVNFGFKGTLPPELIEMNWQFFKDTLDNYFGLVYYHKDGTVDIVLKTNRSNRMGGLK